LESPVLTKWANEAFASWILSLSSVTTIALSLPFDDVVRKTPGLVHKIRQAHLKRGLALNDGNGLVTASRIAATGAIELVLFFGFADLGQNLLYFLLVWFKRSDAEGRRRLLSSAEA
jgi:hypothetical protein